MTALEIAKAAAAALDSKKGQEIRILEIEDLTIIADYFVIASGTSSTQVKALADETDYQLGQLGVTVQHREGHNNSGWILLDFGSVIVHVFQPSTRDFYALERLWADAVEVENK